MAAQISPSCQILWLASFSHICERNQCCCILACYAEIFPHSAELVQISMHFSFILGWWPLTRLERMGQLWWCSCERADDSGRGWWGADDCGGGRCRILSDEHRCHAAARCCKRPFCQSIHLFWASTSGHPPLPISGAWATSLLKEVPLPLLLVEHRLFGTKPLLQQVDNVFCKTGSREREHKRNIYVVAELRRQEAKKTQQLVFQQWPIRPKSYIAGGIWALFGQTRLQCVDDLKVYIFSQGRPFLLGDFIVWDASLFVLYA